MPQVRKYFIFQVLVSFFGSFIAGSLLNQIQQIVQNPSSIVQVLGNAAPQTAGGQICRFARFLFPGSPCCLSSTEDLPLSTQLISEGCPCVQFSL